MESNIINVRVRLVVVKENKLLVQFRQKGNYYHYFGGRLEYGETILGACLRETREECGEDTIFEFKKILYIRDFIVPSINEHSVELFILGDINKFEELEGLVDPQHHDEGVWLTWLNMDNLPKNLLPDDLTEILVSDYKNNFQNEGKYIGKI